MVAIYIDVSNSNHWELSDAWHKLNINFKKTSMRLRMYTNFKKYKDSITSHYPAVGVYEEVILCHESNQNLILEYDFKKKQKPKGVVSRKSHSL